MDFFLNGVTSLLVGECTGWELRMIALAFNSAFGWREKRCFKCSERINLKVSTLSAKGFMLLEGQKDKPLFMTCISASLMSDPEILITVCGEARTGCEESVESAPLEVFLLRPLEPLLVLFVGGAWRWVKKLGYLVGSLRHWRVETPIRWPRWKNGPCSLIDARCAVSWMVSSSRHFSNRRFFLPHSPLPPFHISVSCNFVVQLGIV